DGRSASPPVVALFRLTFLQPPAFSHCSISDARIEWTGVFFFSETGIGKKRLATERAHWCTIGTEAAKTAAIGRGKRRNRKLRNMEKTDPMRHDPGATARKGRLIRGGLALLALLLCAGLAAGPALAGTEPAGARTGGAAFSDIGGHWAADFIEWAVAQGISAGYGDGTFRPGAVVSEREFIAFE